jgi:hypothetical protein
MPDIIRSRDCTIFYYGDSQTVVVSDAMLRGGWAGGQGAQWVGSTVDERVVTYSKGLFGGFLAWGSDERGDDYASITRQQLTYAYATLFSGSCLISTSSYEKYTYLSRTTSGSPLIPIVYQPNDFLYFSLRGLWTTEDELTLSSDSLAPCFFSGMVAQVPRQDNSFYLGIQTSM